MRYYLRVTIRKKLIRGMGGIFIAGLVIGLAGTGFSQSKVPSRKKAVDRFLVNWLVRKDIPSAIRSFDNKALSSPYVLTGCGEGVDRDEKNGEVIRKKVSESLGENASFVKGRSLRSILFLRDPNKKSEFDIAEIIGRIKETGFLNVPKRDRYYLARYQALMSMDSNKEAVDWIALRKQHSLLGAFFSIVQFHGYNDGQDRTDPHYEEPFLAILWIRSGNTWRIATIAAGPCV
jgi:hypothetical protein